MNVRPAPTDDAAGALRASGFRVTPQRLAIHQAVDGATAIRGIVDYVHRPPAHPGFEASRYGQQRIAHRFKVEPATVRPPQQAVFGVQDFRSLGDFGSLGAA